MFPRHFLYLLLKAHTEILQGAQPCVFNIFLSFQKLQGKVPCPGTREWNQDLLPDHIPPPHPQLYLLSHIPNFKQKFISTYNLFGVMKVSSIHHQSICTQTLHSEVWIPLNILSLCTTLPSPSGPHQTDSSCSFSKSCHFTKNYTPYCLLR